MTEPMTVWVLVTDAWEWEAVLGVYTSMDAAKAAAQTRADAPLQWECSLEWGEWSARLNPDDDYPTLSIHQKMVSTGEDTA